MLIFSIAFAIIIIAILYIAIKSYISDSGINPIILLLFSIGGFITYIIIGLQLTIGITDTVILIYYWIAYTVLVISILNVLALGYFWSVVRKKRGMYGIRGHRGDDGDVGMVGHCEIDNSQSIAIQKIVNLIIKLHGDDSNITAKNETTSADYKILVNDYLMDKITTQMTSKQFAIIIEYMTTHSIAIDKLYNYITEIWTIWYKLIANADNKWFSDKYADENWDGFSAGNPFDEIRKYDIYHWGLIDTFRPLTVEICSESSIGQPEMKQPRLKIIESNDYEWYWDDNGSGSERDIITWRLKPVERKNEIFYPIGVVGTNQDEHNAGNYSIRKRGNLTRTENLEYIVDFDGDSDNPGNGPERSSILVSGDIKSPTGFTHHYYVGGDTRRGYMWRPTAPDGYTCLGDLWGGWDAPSKDVIKCIPTDCAVEVPYSAPELGKNSIFGIWNQDDDWLNYVYSMRNSQKSAADNAYYIARSHTNDTTTTNAKFYKINDKCLSPPKLPQKPLEEQYSKVGVGWNGVPNKINPRYSIFTLLGLMPEGVIMSMQTGRNYYIIHYGGVEINRYNILYHNLTTNKWDKALDAVSAAIVEMKILVRNKQQQQWIINQNEMGYYFENYSIRDGAHLVAGLDSVTGTEIFTLNKGELTTANYFKFTSSYGEKDITESD